MTLQGSGVLTNAGSCFVKLQGFQLFPALRGEVDFQRPTSLVVRTNQPGDSYRPRDRSLAAGVATERHAPRPALKQHR